MPSKNKKSQKPQQSSIRLIAGQWRGRKLGVYSADGLRPTGDRVRETLFNWLMADIHGSRCLDLFAGTGALGLEALSRGAKFVQFAELNPGAAKQIEHNLAQLKADNGRVFQGDALRFLQAESEAYDIIFLDPPFAKNLWQSSVDALLANNLIHEHSLIYVEASKTSPPVIHAQLQPQKEKTAGEVRYTLFSCSG